ncbi:hypothetical protein SCLCIDRAFT_1063696 [Scleroderma citrinum Foug A]|uniref:Uncharacterized protein n=1 Tax=Scleroderma citrinum Foug A TaxID=1036808 RepID=A0A0C3A1Y4_9AGAM|nr:hypothetical protein SCLCIDRAFT_1063696 [Scleroderma citrinum Foug A]
MERVLAVGPPHAFALHFPYSLLSAVLGIIFRPTPKPGPNGTRHTRRAVCLLSTTEPIKFQPSLIGERRNAHLCVPWDIYIPVLPAFHCAGVPVLSWYPAYGQLVLCLGRVEWRNASLDSPLFPLFSILCDPLPSWINRCNVFLASNICLYSSFCVCICKYFGLVLDRMPLNIFGGRRVLTLISLAGDGPVDLSFV